MPSARIAAGMSYDIEVVMHELPTAALADELAAEHGLEIDGLFREGGDVLLSHRSGAFQMWGPQAIELDDLADAVIHAAVAPRFALTITIPLGDVRLRPRARKLAESFARSCDGVVYDPQEDRVVFPRSRSRAQAQSSTHALVAVASMWWAFPIELARDTPLRLLLDEIARTLPCALPVRYGFSEPLAERWSDGGADAFVARGLENREDPLPMLFWSARPPCFSGHLYAKSLWEPDDRDKEPDAVEHVVLELSVDASELERPAWRAAVAAAFEAIARCGRAIGAGVWLEHGYTVSRGKLWSDARTSRRRTAEWCRGLPDGQLWLAWFGTDEAIAAARSTFPASWLEARDGGVLLRTSDTPTQAEAVDPCPTLPHAVIYGRPGLPGEQHTCNRELTTIRAALAEEGLQFGPSGLDVVGEGNADTALRVLVAALPALTSGYAKNRISHAIEISAGKAGRRARREAFPALLADLAGELSARGSIRQAYRSYAETALAACGRGDTDALLAVAGDRRYRDARDGSIRALATTDDERVDVMLLDNLADPDVQHTVIQAIARRRLVAARGPLEQLASGDDAELAKAARAALSRLTG
jgi:hypothetical protein